MLDSIIRNVRVAAGGPVLDLGLGQGRIRVIEADLFADAPVIDLNGALLLPGLVETHLHLDKSCILARCAGHDGTLASAIATVAAAKRDFTVEDIYARGRQSLEKAIGQGTNIIRTHVEIDPVVGLKGFEAVSRLKKDFAWALDLQICVFPQDGLTNLAGTDRLLIECLENGADLLGGCPYTDTDPDAQIEWCFQTARDFDVALDFHVDFDLDPSWMHLDEIIRQTDAFHWGGRVSVGHVTKLSVIQPQALAAMAIRLRDAGIAVTSLPSTDLFLMGHNGGPLRPRGVTPVHQLAGHGVTCSLSTNNILNPFTPFGDASLTRIANLYANIAQIGDLAGLRRCLDLVSRDAARLIGRTDFDISIGGPATFVALSVDEPAMAVAEIARPVAGFKNGRQTFANPGPALLFPA